MLYDQALNVHLESGKRFITNFRYNILPEIENRLGDNPFEVGPSALERNNEKKFESQFIS
jgi:hypothetical protein